MFSSESPKFAFLPNIAFHPDVKTISYIFKALESKLAIWPMFPRYNASGRLDDFDEDLSLEDVWQEWENSYNQEYIYECCTRGCGIFECNDVIVAPQHLSLMNMNKYLPILEYEEPRYFSEVAKITDTCGWLMTYLYERNLFLFLANKTFTDKTSLIISYLEKQNAVFGTLSVDSNNVIKGLGLFCDDWLNTTRRMQLCQVSDGAVPVQAMSASLKTSGRNAESGEKMNDDGSF